MAAPSRLRTAASFASMGSILAAATVLGAGCTLDWHLDGPGAQDGSAASDGAITVDGGGPGSEGGVDAGGLDCDGALLCTTFDDGMIIPPFDQTFQGNNGSVRIDTAGAAPHERTLDAHRPATTAGPASAYTQSKNFTQKLTQASIAVDIMPVQLEQGARACIVGLIFAADTPQEHVLRILVGTAGAIVQDRTPATTVGTYNLSQTLAVGRWTSVSLTADVAGQVVVRFDGVPVLDTTISAFGTSSTSTRAFIGVNFTDPATNNYDFHFDNVRVDGH